MLHLSSPPFACALFAVVAVLHAVHAQQPLLEAMQVAADSTNPNRQLASPSLISTLIRRSTEWSCVQHGRAPSPGAELSRKHVDSALLALAHLHDADAVVCTLAMMAGMQGGSAQLLFSAFSTCLLPKCKAEASNAECRRAAVLLNNAGAVMSDSVDSAKMDGSSGVKGVLSPSCRSALLRSFSLLRPSLAIPHLPTTPDHAVALPASLFHLATLADPLHALSFANEAAYLSANGNAVDRDRAREVFFDLYFRKKLNTSSLPCDLAGNAVLALRKAFNTDAAATLVEDTLTELGKAAGRIELRSTLPFRARKRAVDQLYHPSKGKACISPFLSLPLPIGLKTTWFVAVANTPAHGGEEEVWRESKSLHTAGQGRPALVGYLSSDLGRHHPMSHLLSGLFRRHTRAYRAVVFCQGPIASPPVVEHLKKALNVEVVALPKHNPRQAALKMAEYGLTHVVDLSGHTFGADPNILLHRPSPIAINYLGFLGTMGSSKWDYFLSDSVLVPPEYSLFFEEKQLYVPFFLASSYNDSFRAVEKERQRERRHATRSVLADRYPILKKCSVWMAAFNAYYKIDNATLLMWIEVLNDRKDACLCLLSYSEGGMQRIRRAAEHLNAESSSRIVFDILIQNKTDHLSRFSAFDVQLDTATYNGGATTADGVWAGVPFVSIPGTKPTQRMGASIAHAMGMTGAYLARSDDEYVDMLTSSALTQLHRPGKETIERVHNIGRPSLHYVCICACVFKAFRVLYMGWVIHRRVLYTSALLTTRFEGGRNIEETLPYLTSAQNRELGSI
uniref:O-GlcNAc transferase C-terminal domain-containing protein n=1 Tax=Palpitomonas bilix TaxID=652834 RepID=A0A7S3GCN7_9EUKA|mmetsp:Transcript_43612/g.113618  ORF Transcript_43612/g.113618 Transcript_43612/m.113618 type:complete len:791 (+) Transcript_43612:83-2455(+)